MIGNVAPYLQLLREHQAFGELPEQALKTLVVRSDLIAFAPGELLLRQGDESDSALLLTQGEVEVFVETAQGRVELGQLARGALLGEIGVFADLPRTAGVRAKDGVEALRIARDDVLSIGGENLAFLRAVMKQLGQRIAAFNRTVGFYSEALARLERHELDARALDAQPQPLPEFATFAHGFRRMAERFGLRRSHGG
jgi:CRP-like cAMP-binding protein